ncbi:MAG TPA: hypothetical protein VF786_00080, partial [Terriglobales bacterium]
SLRQCLAKRTGGRADSLVFQQVDQTTKRVLVLAMCHGAMETRGRFLAMNADLPFFGTQYQFVAAPCTERSTHRLDGIQAFGTDRQN